MPPSDYRDLRRRLHEQVERWPRGSAKRMLNLAVLGVLVVIVGLAVATSMYTVGIDEVGVVLRLGRYHAMAEPGLHFKLPFGIDRVTGVKLKRVHKEEFGFRTEVPGERTRYSDKEFDEESIMLTADLGIADVEWIVQYKIKDAKDYLFNIKNVTADGGPSTLRDVAENAMRLEVGDSSIGEVLTLRRVAIGLAVKQRMQAILDRYGSGIQIITVELQDVNPPRMVRDSFNDVNRAIQEKQTSINEARREWNKEIPAAAGAASKMLEEAEGYKLKRVNEAQGDVARYSLLLSEYAKAKEVTRARLYLEAFEDVLPEIPRIYVIDGKGSGGGPLQVLDLKESAATPRREAPDAGGRSRAQDRGSSGRASGRKGN